MTFPALSVTIASIIAALACAALHYALKLTNINRLVAYTLGVLAIIIAFWLLVLMEAHATTTWPVAGLAFIAIAGAAGVATLICYGVDSYLRMKNILGERDADKR